MKVGGKHLLLDTDVATFSFAVPALLICAAFAFVAWYKVVEVRASPNGATWQTYLGFVYALWLFVGMKGDLKVVRAARFLLGLLLLVLGIPIAVSLMHLSSQTARALSLWSHLTSAILYTAVTLFLIVWFRDKFRDAKLRTDAEDRV